jgi:hypothetical protein
MDAAQSNYDNEIVGGIIREFAQLSNDRSTFEAQWQEVSEYVMPDMRGTFTDSWQRTPGQKNTEKQIDSTAALANSRFGAIMDSLLTPRNNFWHGLEADDELLNKNRNVKLWFEDTTKRLFKARYAPTANFSSQNQMVYKQIGAFGTASMFIDRYIGDDSIRGLRYKSLPIGEVYLKENHQGQVDGFVRVFYMTARQAVQKFKEKTPEVITKVVQTNPEQKFKFLHCVKPRGDYAPGQAGVKGKRYGSYYVSWEGHRLVQEGGYNTFPLPTTRYEQYPGEIYGRGPGMMTLPAIKTLNATKRIMLKQGHRSVDPVLLSRDDGITGFNLKPGSINGGQVTADGKPLVHALPVGNIAVGKDLMDDERGVINDAFLVRLFQVLLEDPKVLTATQVVEMANEKGILLAPTIGGQQSGYLGPMIDRELDLMSDMGLLLPMPPELVEARGAYHVTYTSPFSKAAKAQEVSGLLRTIEGVLEVVNVTQNPEPLDHFDWDVIIPEMSDIQSVPTRWMRAMDKVQAIRLDRAKKQQQQMDIQAGPAAAALIKAQNGAKGK